VLLNEIYIFIYIIYIYYSNKSYYYFFLYSLQMYKILYLCVEQFNVDFTLTKTMRYQLISQILDSTDS